MEGPRLHLGCGERYLEGYVNIDFPSTLHTILQPRVEMYADITQLEFKDESIVEIRSHHVFEHFDFPTALRLLIQWHRWLVCGGSLIIETPDFEASAKLILKGSLQEAMVAARHLYGSQEAAWAYHRDAWWPEKFKFYSERLGFSRIQFKKSNWRGTDNVTATAEKGKSLSENELLTAAEQILRQRLVDDSGEGARAATST